MSKSNICRPALCICSVANPQWTCEAPQPCTSVMRSASVCTCMHAHADVSCRFTFVQCRSGAEGFWVTGQRCARRLGGWRGTLTSQQIVPSDSVVFFFFTSYHPCLTSLVKRHISLLLCSAPSTFPFVHILTAAPSVRVHVTCVLFMCLLVPGV